MNRLKYIQGVYIPIFFSSIFFSACTYDKEFTYLNDQIIATNQKITQLQKAVDTKLQGDLDSRLRSIQTNQAEIGAEMDSIRNRLQELGGRVDESEHVVKRTVEADLTSQDAVRKELSQLSPKLKELQDLVNAQQTQIEQLSTKIDQLSKVRASANSKSTLSQDVERYDYAYALFKEKKFDQAMTSFQQFLEEYPKSDRADNAQFWIGECLMGLKQYDRAILAFQQVIEKYPKGNKVPSAMLRQAMAFTEIDDKTSSQLLLKKVVKEFPNSDEAKTAQAKLDKME
jgi:tol-pal system protein YbgF